MTLRSGFTNPGAQRVLEGLVAVTMWLIAFKIAGGLYDLRQENHDDPF